MKYLILTNFKIYIKLENLLMKLGCTTYILYKMLNLWNYQIFWWNEYSISKIVRRLKLKYSHWFWMKASHAWVDVKICLVFSRVSDMVFWSSRCYLETHSIVRNLKKGIKVKVILFFINENLSSVNISNNWNIKIYGYLLVKKKHWELPWTIREIFKVKIFY